MIVDRGRKREVYIRHRVDDPSHSSGIGERITKKVTSIYPYGYIRETDTHLVDAIRREPGFKGLYGENLTKVTMADPAQVGKLKNQLPQTWECNIPFTNRVLSERIRNGEEPIPNYNHRVWFWDMEWKPETDEITIISVYDNMTERLFTLFSQPDLPEGKIHKLPCSNHPDGIDEISFNPPALNFHSERDMLIRFTKLIRKHDPDVLTGWNVVNADCQVLIKRMERCGLDPKKLSPIGIIRYDFRDWDQPIGGVNVIDMMVAFCRLWEIKNGALPNKKLVTVAQEALGDTKLDLQDGHDTFYSDFGTYVDYNRKDVELLPLMDNILNPIKHHLAIQHLAQCDIRTTPFITRLFTCLALNDTKFDYCIPSRAQFRKEEYDGADIQEPVPGVYENIGILDVKAMYHSNAAKYNISWDTLDDDGYDCGNGTKFSQSEPGLLVRQMDLMTDLRNEYKAKMKKAKTPREKSKWDAMQYATKSLVASMYGAAGDSKYGLYHPEVAAAITFTSRNTLRELRDACEDRGYPVVYGHTDSVFVKIPTPEEGMVMLSEINNEMYPVVTEFEKWCKRLLITGKNRYAARVEWSDGVGHPPTQYVKGIELKQSRLPDILKSVMSLTIESILVGESETILTNRLETLILDVLDKKVEPRGLCIKARLKRNLEDYTTLGEARAGAAWANKNLGKGYVKGDYFLSTLSDEGSYLAFDDPKEIEGVARIGYKRICERFIIDKVRNYYEIMRWDMQPLHNALNGLSNLAWL